MSIMEQLVNEMEHGGYYFINFNKRYLKIGTKEVVKDGKFNGEYGISTDKPLEQIEELYNSFYNSRAGEKADARCTYFTARDSDEMSSMENLIGEDRLVAIAKLEGFILGLILSGFQWEQIDKDVHHTYWQSEKYPGLILWREWFQKSN